MSTQPQRAFLTPEEYLKIERNAEFKSEYLNGEMFAMAGVRRAHDLIAMNVYRVLGNQLLERDCHVYSSDMRVKIKKIDKYTYPDVAVTCGKEVFEDDQVDTLLNPIVIIEILSDSSKAYDPGKKFQHYQFIDSLVEYILIAQDTIHVDHYVRQKDKTWLRYEYKNPDDTVKLESIGCELALKDIYMKLPDIRAEK
jgi:Uma2 family endonuclease